MSIEKDESGRRSIEVSIEVPCTPEEVWETIATGPGVAAWFMPMEMREGVGDVEVDTPAGKQVIGKITKWEPPHHIVSEGKNLGIDGPTVGTEWILEAAAGGKCVVRVVNSLFDDSGDWDGELENLKSGWPRFFQVMRLYLEQYRGVPAMPIMVMRPVTLGVTEAWTALRTALGVEGLAVGERWALPGGGPSATGVIAEPLEADKPSGMVHLDAPTPGVLAPFAVAMGGQVMVQVNVYLYGDDAATVAGRDAPVWQSWLDGLASLGAQEMQA